MKPSLAWFAFPIRLSNYYLIFLLFLSPVLTEWTIYSCPLGYKLSTSALQTVPSSVAALCTALTQLSTQPLITSRWLHFRINTCFILTDLSATSDTHQSLAFSWCLFIINFSISALHRCSSSIPTPASWGQRIEYNSRFHPHFSPVPCLRAISQMNSLLYMMTLAPKSHSCVRHQLKSHRPCITFPYLHYWFALRKSPALMELCGCAGKRTTPAFLKLSFHCSPKLLQNLNLWQTLWFLSLLLFTPWFTLSCRTATQLKPLLSMTPFSHRSQGLTDFSSWP